MTATSATPIRSIDDLHPKMELTGTVKQIELFGAFVDIGVEYDGLLHISQVRKEHTGNVENVLQIGQEVTVWVRKVDRKARRVDLTMIEPLAVEWNELKVGQACTGKVVRLESFGAFVDIGAERPGMVHVRELTAGYVKHPSDVVSLGDEVEVKVIGVNKKKRQIDLSIKALEEEALQAVEEDEGPPPTAMELALRAAMGDSVPARGKQKRKRRKSHEAGREDIFRRTLEQHRDN